MSFLDWEALQNTPLRRDPFDHLVITNFVTPKGLSELESDYPEIAEAGSFPLESLRAGKALQALKAELESDRFRKCFEQKFQIDLSGRPTTITLRGISDTRDGHVHTDSNSKLATVLIYPNPAWKDPGGRLRLLRSRDIDDVAVEIPPEMGNLVAFPRSERAWHGYPLFIGKRRAIQFNWVTGSRSRKLAIFRHQLSAQIKRLRRIKRLGGSAITSQYPEPRRPA